MITAKINVSKIDKNRLYKGEKGVYLDVVLVPTPNSEFQDYLIKQNTTKEEREKGVELPIIGGAKNFSNQLSDKEKDDLPF